MYLLNQIHNNLLIAESSFNPKFMSDYQKIFQQNLNYIIFYLCFTLKIRLHNFFEQLEKILQYHLKLNYINYDYFNKFHLSFISLDY